MSKETLISTAKELKQPNAEAKEEFSKKASSLVEKMNEFMLNRPDISDLVGVENLDMMKDNHANHVRFMESVFTDYIPEILVDTCAWVFRAYRSRGFSST